MILRAYLLFILALTLNTSLSAQAQNPPSPSELCSQMKQGLVKAKVGCVALSVNGGQGSAVVISPDGLVITASHIATRAKNDKPCKITYEDGTTAEVEVLGWNLGSDIALLKITTPSDKPWPHVEISKEAPLTGAFCFTYAHPSGQFKDRPAQLRIGRIVTHSVKRGKTCLLTADCIIQPGDSGGGLFSLDGKLIGIDSSAANLLEMNLFPAIDQYHLDQKRLLNKERWGDVADRPDNAQNLMPKVTPEAIAKVQAEFARRIKLNYPPAIDFALKRRQPDGTVNVKPQEIVNLMTRDTISYALGQSVSLGLDDPAITQQLKPLPQKHTKGLAIYGGKKRLCVGLPLNKQHIITKASLLKGSKDLSIHFAGKTYPIALHSINKEWDIAIVKLKEKLPLSTIIWPAKPVKIEAGDLLIAPDSQGRLLWGNATDKRRIVVKKRSIGPIDQSLISQHRAPYPTAIRNSLPLFAADAGTPVFDTAGNFVGMHVARFSRTMALILPSEKLQTIAKAMLEKTTAAP